MSLAQRIANRSQLLLQGRIQSFPLYLPFVRGKHGLEIGGPSRIFTPWNPCPLYSEVGSLDNCDFSSTTVWAQHQAAYVFSKRKPLGDTLFCEGSKLAGVEDNSYDFILSSHNLEHFANPVKALVEWKRVLRPRSALILIFPDYRRTFDHHRTPTTVDHMLEDFEHDMGEDDLTHLPEILDKHDLSKDLAAGSKEQFHTRSLNNLANRCLHHHVFDEHNGKELLTRTGFEVLATDLALPFHICLLATAP